MAHINHDMRACIDECQDCHEVCLETLTHCLSMGGKHAAPEHLGLLQDCADICRTSADFMLRGSTHHAHTCAACAAVCDACAASCEQLGGAEMARCAEACRACAESCRSMAQAGV